MVVDTLYSYGKLSFDQKSYDTFHYSFIASSAATSIISMILSVIIVLTIAIIVITVIYIKRIASSTIPHMISLSRVIKALENRASDIQT